MGATQQVKSPPPHGWRWIGRVLLRAILISSLVVSLVLALRAYALLQAYLRPARLVARGDLLRTQGFPLEEIWLTTEDGIALRAFSIPARNGAVILVAHGHGATIDESVVAMFARHGYGVLAWEFRAHGRSGGERSTLGYQEVLDVKAALQMAQQQAGAERIGIWGDSMGGATAIEAAAREPAIQAVVADSAFDTLEGAFQRRVPALLRPFVWLYAVWETGLRPEAIVRPVESIGRIAPRPVFLIQGLADQVIPPQSAQRLFDAAGEPKFLWQEAGVGHSAMRQVYPEEYERRVIAFFDWALLDQPPGR